MEILMYIIFEIKFPILSIENIYEALLLFNCKNYFRIFNVSYYKGIKSFNLNLNFIDCLKLF